MAVLSEEQTMLRDAAKSWAREKSPVTALRKLRDAGNPDGFDRAAWAEMCEMGWAGILVPEDVEWIPAVSGGRIEKILVLPGAAVGTNTIILELSNPELAQAVFDAKWQLRGAEADLTNLQVQLESQRLTQQAAAATANASAPSMNRGDSTRTSKVNVPSANSRGTDTASSAMRIPLSC